MNDARRLLLQEIIEQSNKRTSGCGEFGTKKRKLSRIELQHQWKPFWAQPRRRPSMTSKEQRIALKKVAKYCEASLPELESPPSMRQLPSCARPQAAEHSCRLVELGLEAKGRIRRWRSCFMNRAAMQQEIIASTRSPLKVPNSISASISASPISSLHGSIPSLQIGNIR
jgi:hypothetical protein